MGKILKLFGVTFGVSIIDYILALLSSILIIKQLSVADYGYYNLLNSIGGFVVTFCTLGLAQYNYRILPGREKDEQDEVIGKTLFVEIVMSVIGLIVAFVLIRDQLPLSKIILAFFAVKMITYMAGGELIRCLGYRRLNMRKAGYNFLHEKLWVLILMVGVLVFGSEATLTNIYGTQALCCVFVFGLLLYAFRSKTLFANFKPSLSFLRNNISRSISFVFIDVGIYFLENGIRYVLFLFGSEESTAYYSFGYNWISIIFRFGMILIYLLQPYFSAEYYKIEKKEETNYDRLYAYQNFALKYSIYIILFALAFFLLNFDDLVLIVGKAEYLQTKQAVYGFALLPICMCFAYFFQILLVLAGKSKQLPFYYISGTVIVIILNFIFVPLFDYFASAVITTATYFVLMIIFYNICPKEMFRFRVRPFDALFMAGTLAVFVALLLLIQLLPGLYLRFAVDCVVIVLTICFIFYVNRKDFEFFKQEKLT